MPLLQSNISKHRFDPKAIDQSLNEPYFKAKLGKFTSSEFHYLMAPEGIGKAGLNYIYRKVGEELSGRSSKQEFTAAATDHGLEYEMEGLLAFVQWLVDNGKTDKDIDMRTQKLIFEGERNAGTPDGLWVNSERELDMTVRTVECKCPFSFDGYIRLWKCTTPAELKKLERDGAKFYYQCLHQMSMCGSLIGYLVAYQPFFSHSKIRVITFDTADEEIRKEIKKVNERKLQAEKIFNDTITELKNG